MEYKVACVIVTYNRKELLVKCIQAIIAQQFKPHSVYIIDNASTDGTDSLITFLGLNNTTSSSINFIYKKLDENIGGAGGFYTGIKLAFESVEHFDGIWVMDDDGLPEEKQLYHLISYLNKFDYLSPFVLSIENPELPAFISLDLLKSTPVDEFGNYIGLANPFNGVLYSRKLVANIGYPKKEMFIWGDELNYEYRALHAGYVPLLVKDAIHYHPYNRQIKLNTICGRKIAVPNENWKLYCLIRNRVYNAKIKKDSWLLLKRVVAEVVDYSYFFILHLQMSRLKVLLSAISDGLNENFENPRRYM